MNINSVGGVPSAGPSGADFGVDPAQLDTLTSLLVEAGPLAAGTLLAALHSLHDECARAGDATLLVAGAPDTWESRLLLDMVKPCVPAGRACPDLAVSVYAIIAGWVFGPRTFPQAYPPGGQARPVDVAGAVSAVFGRVLDVAGGWERVGGPPEYLNNPPTEQASEQTGEQAGRSRPEPRLLLGRRSRYHSGVEQ